MEEWGIRLHKLSGNKCHLMKDGHFSVGTEDSIGFQAKKKIMQLTFNFKNINCDSTVENEFGWGRGKRSSSECRRLVVKL